jgi:YVTN family beta-propeller protein
MPMTERLQRLFNFLLTTTLIGASPVLAADRAYVANYLSGDLSVIDLASRSEIDRIGVGSGPADVAVAPDHSVLYVTNRNDDTVSVVDPRAGATVATIVLQDCGGLASPCRPADVAFRPDGRRAYVAHAGPSGCTASFCPALVSVIDVSRHEIITTVALTFEAAYGIALTPDGRFAYVTGHRFYPMRYDTHIQAIDTATNRRLPEVLDFGLAHEVMLGLGEIPPPFLPRTDIIITPDGRLAYVSDGWSNSITRLDLLTTVRTQRYLGGEEAIDGLALTADGSSFVVTRPNCVPLTLCAAGGEILRVRTPGDSITATLDGNGAAGVAVDGSLAYVAEMYDDGVAVIDLDTNDEIDFIPTGNQPYRIALAELAECPNDCDGDGRVDVADLVTLINIALGDVFLSTCPGGDLDADRRITVDEIIAAVDAALGGCG